MDRIDMIIDKIMRDTLGDEAVERLNAAREEKISRMGEAQYILTIREEHDARLLKELEEANTRKAQKLLEISGLGKRFFNRTFESFETNDKNEKAYKAARGVVTGRIKGVLLTGSNGIGKTHLAAAIVNELTAQGKIVRFGNLVELMDRYGDNVMDSDLIVIDDLGQEYAVGYKSDDVKVYLYKLINKLYEQERGIVITTNLNADQTEEKYGAAVLSRLQEMCEFIGYEDEDQRHVQSLESGYKKLA